MSLTVMLAVLAAAALHASWNAIGKAASGKAGDVIAVGVTAGALAALALPFLPLPDRASWPQLAASAVIHLAYFKLLELAYRTGDLSVAYPLMRGTPPLVTALGAWALLAEPLSPAGWTAVGIIVAGALTLAGDGLHTHRVGARSLAIVGANILVIVAYTLVDGRVSRVGQRAELHLDVRPHGADAGAGAAVARRSRSAAIAWRVGTARGRRGVHARLLRDRPLGDDARADRTGRSAARDLDRVRYADRAAWLRERVSAALGGVALIAAGGAAMKLA
jgi:multidrug transporter EmrE-like cation transporter